MFSVSVSIRAVEVADIVGVSREVGEKVGVIGVVHLWVAGFVRVGGVGAKVGVIGVVHLWVTGLVRIVFGVGVGIYNTRSRWSR